MLDLDGKVKPINTSAI